MFTFDLQFGVFRLYESDIAVLTFRVFHRTRERHAIIVHDSIVFFRRRR